MKNPLAALLGIDTDEILSLDGVQVPDWIEQNVPTELPDVPVTDDVSTSKPDNNWVLDGLSVLRARRNS